jgi:hypothetical protein
LVALLCIESNNIAHAASASAAALLSATAKTNFPLQNYLGEDGSQPGSAKDALRSAAAAAAESPRAPGGLSDRADVPTRRRSSYAGDGSAKASHGQHSELSWGVVGFPRSSRLSHDASEGAPRSTPRWVDCCVLSPACLCHSLCNLGRNQALNEVGVHWVPASAV